MSLEPYTLYKCSKCEENHHTRKTYIVSHLPYSTSIHSLKHEITIVISHFVYIMCINTCITQCICLYTTLCKKQIHSIFYTFTCTAITSNSLKYTYTIYMTWTQKIKRGFWSFFLYPIFPYIEHLFVFIHKRTRQRFHVGWLAPETTLEAMKEHLSKKYGFGNHFIAWEDQGQVLSWRKLDGFDYQFHLRVFADGEIRGHYEKLLKRLP